MASEICTTPNHRIGVFFVEFVLWHAAVHLERLGCSYKNHRVRMETGFAAFNIEELLRAEFGAESGFRNNVVRQF